MIKIISFLLLVLSLLYLIGSNSTPMLNKTLAVALFLNEISSSQKNRSYIIYVANNNYKEAIDNISNKWMTSNGMNPNQYKKSLKNESNKHSAKLPNIKLTAQNIYYSKIGVTFCIIHDKNSLIEKYVNKEHLNDFKTLIVLHEIEHCYINTMNHPIYSYEEFNPYFDKSMSISEKKKIYRFYMKYLQEIYADIAAVEIIERKTKRKDFKHSIITTRKQLAKKGDFFHESSSFILDYQNKYNRKTAFSRDHILDYLHSNSLKLMPISTFIENVYNKDTYLP